VPQDYVGAVITLCTQKRGVQRNMQYLGRQVMLTYDMPMNEVVMDFFDRSSPPAVAMPRWITSSRNSSAQIWSSWMYWSTAKRWMRSA
jgi:hypothetical protein